MPTPTPLATTPVSNRESRRSFLQKSACAVGVASAIALQPTYAFATPNNPAAGDALIIIFLRGAADGLSLTPPIGSAYDTYAALRPTIRITPDQSLALDSTNPNVAFPQGLDGVVGMHPALLPLYESVWANGQMAVIPASGMPDEESQTRSHFESQQFWERGSASQSVRTGILARLEAALNAAGPVSTVSTDRNSTELLRGATRGFNISNLDGFGVNGFDNRDRASGALGRMYDGGTGLVNMEGAATLNVATTLQALDVNGVEGFPNTNFGRDLRDVSVLLKSNVGLASAVVNLSNWDHHNELGSASEGRFFDKTTELAQGLRSFIDELGPDGVAETTIAVISEFGRTIDENGNGGTDHGRAGTMFLIGGGVQGGVFGNDYPTEIAEVSGNRRALPVLTDYRQGLEEVLESRVNVTGIFPTKAAGTPLGVVRS